LLGRNERGSYGYGFGAGCKQEHPDRDWNRCADLQVTGNYCGRGLKKQEPPAPYSNHPWCDQKQALQPTAPSGFPARLLRRSPKKQQPLHLTRVFGYTIEDDFPARIREARILQGKLVGHVVHSAISVDVFHVAHAVDDVQV
jgi:hypothetical protein